MVNSTQQAIDIAGIKDGIVVMKNGSYRLVLQVSATNFALKSEQEQNSLVFQYQGFLNSLHFPIQIVVRSRQLDLTPYIARVEKLLETQTNELVKMQTTDYIDFLKKLIEMANIMKKTFYVVIAYEPITLRKTGIMDKLFAKKTVFDHLKISETEYKNNTGKLKERASVAASGLGSMGLHCFQLSTEQLIELYYQIFNPDDSSKERIKDVTMLSSPIIMSEEEFSNAEGVKVSTKEEGLLDNTQVVEERKKQEAQNKKQDEMATEKVVEKLGIKGKETPPKEAAQPVAANPAPVQNQAAANPAPVQNQAAANPAPAQNQEPPANVTTPPE